MQNKSTDSKINEVKVYKHALFQDATETFIYNLKQFIAIEGTQKKLAQSIGVSEELLSKYKNGDAFPSIETLMIMAERYSITLDRLLREKVDQSSDRMFNQRHEAFRGEDQNAVLPASYFIYFFVTNIDGKGLLHEGRLIFQGKPQTKAAFEIYSDKGHIKTYMGECKFTPKMIFLHLANSKEEGEVSIHLINPPKHDAQYVGGLGLMMLPSDASSKPCAQRILVSRVPIARDKYASYLDALLKLEAHEQDDNCFEKINASQDERAYIFIRKVERESGNI